MKDNNIIINGVGGQGLITLLKIISQAAFNEGYDVKSSELHGLAQRGGAVEVHLKFGKKVFSPLVAKGKADLILSMEKQEALVVSYYASKKAKTVFLINKYRTPTLSQTLSDDDILKSLKKISPRVILVPASEICQKELGTDVVAGVYLLGVATAKNILLLKKESVLKAIKDLMPEKYFDINKKAFEAGQKHG